MKKSSIKEAFGGEVSFTKYIANHPDVAARLLESVDTGMSESFSVAPEDGTVDRKRVDLVVRDEDDNVVQVIESQDATGWLDSIHASKIAYYCYEKECMDGVLITEDADEHIKGFVRWYNENTPLNIYLIYANIFETEQGPYVDFVPVMRPFSLRDKKIQRKTSAQGDVARDDFEEFFLEKHKEYPGKFTHPTRRYISTNNVGGSGANVGIHARKSGYWLVDIYHSGKADKAKFKETYSSVFPYDDVQFTKVSGYLRRDTWDEAVETFDLMVESLNNKSILVK